MGFDDFATARRYPYPSENDAADEAHSANVFTPISAADRLREKPRHRRGHSNANARPMLIPGQRYGYDAYDEEPLPYAVPFPAEEKLILGNEDQGAAPLDRYQQAYWAHLQGVSGLPSQAAPLSEDALHIPAYLKNCGTSGQEEPPGYFTEQIANYPQSAVEAGFSKAPQHRGDVLDEVFGESQTYAQTAPLEMTAYDPWQEEHLLDAGMVEKYVGIPEYAEPYGNGMWHAPENRAAGMPKGERRKAMDSPAPSAAPLLSRAKEGVAKAFASKHLENRQRFSFGKVAAVCAITVMLVFCVIEMGKIVLDLLQNEEEMKAVREEYYAKSGTELLMDASRVELLPPGVTFTPTATPPPIEGLAQVGDPTEGEVVNAVAQEEPGGAVATLNQRTKAASYVDNPMGNIREEFESLRANNTDTVGHLVIDGVADEIVVQRNNTYYLTHSARGSFSASGAVFMDEACSIKSPPENVLLRGQSAGQNNPFQSLRGYVDGGAEYVRQHALVRFDTLYEEAQYVVFAVVMASSDPQSPQYFNYAGYPSFLSDRQMESYVNAAKQQSLYEIPVEVLPSDRLLTLSTIGDGTTKGSLVIMARKLRAGETAQSFSKALGAIRVQ